MEVLTNDIVRRAVLYFLDHTTFERNSKAYGLTPDHSKKKGVASIAATGFFLSALVIAAHEGMIASDDARNKARRTLETLLSLDHRWGFMPHFLDMEDGTRHKRSEYSTIDTALMLNGVITADAFFKDPDITSMAHTLLSRIDWDAFIFSYHGKPTLRMAYNPDKDGDYVQDKPGFIHQWDMTAEQLMMYPMIASSDWKNQAKALYEAIEKPVGSYGGHTFVHGPGNTLFTYQFPLAWLDLKGVKDENGLCWHDNAREAVLAHRALSVNLMSRFPTFSHHRFGFTASDTPQGYRVFSGLPNAFGRVVTDGTVAPFSVVGSLPFIPEDALEAIHDMKTLEGLYGPYGFMDAFNLEQGIWISDKIISIDKGLEMLMAHAMHDDVVRKSYMSHPVIRNGLETIGFNVPGTTR
jgi:hypothetical protein